MVLFVTGLCRFRCFYCPVSGDRNQKDVVYANERLVASRRGRPRRGAGDRRGRHRDHRRRSARRHRPAPSTTSGSSRGRSAPSHNIHLYTHEPNAEKLERLARAGLDEFRLHIPHYLWGPLAADGGAYREVLEDAPRWGIRRGVEIPVLPEKEAELRRLLVALDGIGVDFVNLNELEFSETNEDKLHDRRYELDPRNGWGVRGSRAVAERIVRESRLSVPVHYCSSRFKDGVQLRQRLHPSGRPDRARRSPGSPTTGRSSSASSRCPAAADAGPRTRPASSGPRRARRRRTTGSISSDGASSSSADRLRRGRAAARASRAFEVEEYPTADALEVEREPLNTAAFPGFVGAGGT